MRVVKNRVFIFLRCLKKKISEDRVLVEASALTYVTVLSFVPLFAVIFSLFSAFITKGEIDQKLLSYLDRFFLPESAQAIVLYLKEFSAKAKTLSITGSIILISIALVLFEAAEGTLNRIWKVKKGRSFLNKLFVFTNFIFWIPLLLGLAIYFSFKFSRFQALGGLVVSFVLVFFGFFILNFIIPHRKVEIKAAVLGAFVSSVLWIFLKHFFDIYVNYALSLRTMRSIYGSLFIIPVFLVWVFFSWVVALVGAVVAFIYQFGCEDDGSSSLACELWSLFEVLCLFDTAFEEGRRLRLEDISKRLNLNVEKVWEILEFLREKGLVVFSEEGFFVLARDLAQLRVRDVFDGCAFGDSGAFRVFLEDFGEISLKDFVYGKR
ncbi:MAG: YihY family inner membrane protein [Deferribacteres bacterium]|nr:YihY family inner membrane protein [Deferribacteres bacterium]